MSLTEQTKTCRVRKEVTMTNMRAYRDGKRLVIVIEDPTKDLESLVAAMLTGEIKSVKDLDEPKKMARPEIDLKKMEEVKPETKDVPRKAAFVKKLEEETAKTNESGRMERVQEERVNPSEAEEVREEAEPEEKAPVEARMERKPENAVEPEKTESPEEVRTEPEPKVKVMEEVHTDESAEKTVAPIEAKAETNESTSVHEEPEEISEKADIRINTEAAISEERTMKDSTHTMPEADMIPETRTMQENAHHERAVLREPPIESVIRFIQARSKTPKTLSILRKEYKTTDVNVVLKKLDERAIREFARSIR